MLAGEIMIRKIATVTPDTTMDEIASKMLQMETAHVVVVDAQGRLQGLVSGFDLRRALAERRTGAAAKEMMTPRGELAVVFPDTPVEDAAQIFTGKEFGQLPVIRDEIPLGYLSLVQVLRQNGAAGNRPEGMLGQLQQAGLLIHAMHEGLIAVDRDYRVCEFNRAAERYTGISAEKIIGSQSRLYRDYHSPVRLVMENGEPLFNVEVRDKKGRVFMTNNVPIGAGGAIEGVLQTFTDITDIKNMQLQLLKTRDELDKAFALTLPNSRVEHKLKTTPEYRDYFDPSTGMIKITEVIEDGGYHHVVNALKVAADLNEKGMMSLPGIDKDILVQALIFHDVGKSQPALNTGQEVDPRRVFEESPLHAGRSADLVEQYYQKPREVVTLIRYHHHREDELPPDFPTYLFPMFRLLRIIDGLSAGLTRRDARIGFRVNGSRLTVLEHNSHPGFQRTMEVDLYTGQEFVYTEKKVETMGQEALPH